MTQARKRRGLETQNRLAEYLAAHGWPYAESAGAGRAGTDVTGTPGIAWECKARTDFNPVGWVRQAEKSAGLPVAVYRPNGIGPHPENFIAMVRLADLVPLLLAAGYGGYVQNPAERTVKCAVDGHERNYAWNCPACRSELIAREEDTPPTPPPPPGTGADIVRAAMRVHGIPVTDRPTERTKP